MNILAVPASIPISAVRALIASLGINVDEVTREGVVIGWDSVRVDVYALNAEGQRYLSLDGLRPAVHHLHIPVDHSPDPTALTEDQPPEGPSMTTADWSERHASSQHIIQFFSFDHLPAGLMSQISEHSAALAHTMLHLLPDGPELSAGMRRLLEAKDCFVRAALLANRASKS